MWLTAYRRNECGWSSYLDPRSNELAESAPAVSACTCRGLHIRGTRSACAYAHMDVRGQRSYVRWVAQKVGRLEPPLPPRLRRPWVMVKLQELLLSPNAEYFIQFQSKLGIELLHYVILTAMSPFLNSYLATSLSMKRPTQEFQDHKHFRVIHKS